MMFLNYRVKQSFSFVKLYSFDVFPNPTQNSTMTVQFEAEASGEYTINIRDILGRMHKSYISLDQKDEVDIQLPGKGIYFIELALDGKKLINKKVLSN